MSKRLIGFFVILLILAACGDDSSDTQPTLTRPALTPTAVPTTLSVWYSDPQMTEAYTTVLAEFEKSYPHISLHLTLQDPNTFPATLDQSLAAGGEPDVIFAPAVLLDSLLARRHLLPLDSEQIALLNVFVPAGALDAGRRDEQLYGFPIQTHVPVLVYNASQEAPEN
ncbi:MAG: ABC transporter substrate-binding protein, partial [Anaerolineae bacterium]|nr:ABC transporter substrate-binding protein [Anaerolineae bacterium]